jgi:hypothetical protein
MVSIIQKKLKEKNSQFDRLIFFNVILLLIFYKFSPENIKFVFQCFEKLMSR